MVHPRLKDSAAAYLIGDDRVQNQQYWRKIEPVKKQYRGAVHGLVRGIGVVNRVHSDGQDFYPIDDRISAPEADGKTQNDPFRQRVLNAKSDQPIKARTRLFDRGYASVDNLKLLQRRGRFFITPLKDKRRVRLSKAAGSIHRQAIEWTEHRLTDGVPIQLKAIRFKVQLFKRVAPNGDLDWVITNHPEGCFTTAAIQDEPAGRWQIEQLHRELKQLTGSEKCEGRKARSQRNHLACCYLAWLALKVKAHQLGKTLYAVQH